MGNRMQKGSWHDGRRQSWLVLLLRTSLFWVFLVALFSSVSEAAMDRNFGMGFRTPGGRGFPVRKNDNVVADDEDSTTNDDINDNIDDIAAAVDDDEEQNDDVDDGDDDTPDNLLGYMREMGYIAVLLGLVLYAFCLFAAWYSFWPQYRFWKARQRAIQRVLNHEPCPTHHYHHHHRSASHHDTSHTRSHSHHSHSSSKKRNKSNKHKKRATTKLSKPKQYSMQQQVFVSDYQQQRHDHHDSSHMMVPTKSNQPHHNNAYHARNNHTGSTQNPHSNALPSPQQQQQQEYGGDSSGMESARDRPLVDRDNDGDSSGNGENPSKTAVNSSSSSPLLLMPPPSATLPPAALPVSLPPVPTDGIYTAYYHEYGTASRVRLHTTTFLRFYPHYPSLVQGLTTIARKNRRRKRQEEYHEQQEQQQQQITEQPTMNSDENDNNDNDNSNDAGHYSNNHRSIPKLYSITGEGRDSEGYFIITEGCVSTVTGRAYWVEEQQQPTEVQMPLSTIEEGEENEEEEEQEDEEGHEKVREGGGVKGTIRHDPTGVVGVGCFGCRCRILCHRHSSPSDRRLRAHPPPPKHPTTTVGPTFRILNTGTFDFVNNTFSGNWKTNDGSFTRGHYTGFRLLRPWDGDDHDKNDDGDDNNSTTDSHHRSNDDTHALPTRTTMNDSSRSHHEDQNRYDANYRDEPTPSSLSTTTTTTNDDKTRCNNDSNYYYTKYHSTNDAQEGTTVVTPCENRHRYGGMEGGQEDEDDDTEEEETKMEVSEYIPQPEGKKNRAFYNDGDYEQHIDLEATTDHYQEYHRHPDLQTDHTKSTVTSLPLPTWDQIRQQELQHQQQLHSSLPPPPPPPPEEDDEEDMVTILSS